MWTLPKIDFIHEVLTKKRRGFADIDSDWNSINTAATTLHCCPREAPACNASGRRVEYRGDPRRQADRFCEILVHGDDGSASIHHECHRRPVDRTLDIEMLVMRAVNDDNSASVGCYGAPDLWRDESIKGEIADSANQ